MWICLGILFPLGVFKFLTDSHDVGEEFLPKVLTNLILDPHGDEIHFCIHIHGNYYLSLALANWLVLQHKEFVFQLNIFWVYVTFISKFLL